MLKSVIFISGDGKMDFPDEILLRIFSFVEPGYGTRLSILQTSKWVRNACLLDIWKPWELRCKGLRYAVKKGYIGYFRRWKKLAPEPSLSFLGPYGGEQSVLEIAAANGHLDFVKMFIRDPLACSDGPLDPSINNWLAFRRACSAEQVKVIRYFLQNTDVYPSVLGEDALLFSCRNGQDKTVKTLLKDGRCCPTTMDDYCIKKACKYGHTKVVELLLDDGRADPNAGGGLPIAYAYENGHREIFNALWNDYRVKVPRWLLKDKDETSSDNTSEDETYQSRDYEERTESEDVT